MNDDRLKEDVKSRINLADWIIRDGIPLKGSGNEWAACCPFHPDKNPSFHGFCKDGVWGYFGHGCRAGGDIYTWIMERKGLAFSQALRLAAHEIGVSIPEPRIYQPEEVRTAAESKRGSLDASRYRSLVQGGKVYAYLTEKRKLRPDQLALYSVGEIADGEAYAFAYKWQPDSAKPPRTEFLKVVKVDRVDGKKEEWRDPKGGKNILFGMMAVPADAQELIICEGEIDAITWSQYGFPAVSVPCGAASTTWIPVCWDWLQRFRKLHISFDEDRAGRLKVSEIVTRLGMARTDIIRLPMKEGA